MFKHVHHVHYVVENRDAMVEYLEKHFGMKPYRLATYEDSAKENANRDKNKEIINGQKDAHYKVDKTLIQFTEPIPNSAMGRHLAKHGPGLWHVAWAVEDILKVSQELDAKGNKMSNLYGRKGLTQSPRGYITSNIDPVSSHGVWFQLAEGSDQE